MTGQLIAPPGVDQCWKDPELLQLHSYQLVYESLSLRGEMAQKGVQLDRRNYFLFDLSGSSEGSGDYFPVDTATA
ncbi:hypothetical protein L3Q82_007115 [Scortum barcoo]|uniref:Uncharacterized protein n=1 Tax=Scortum barcoo TaxID=214431 RepID=A0ACB8WTZ1_9TELE|nr:hypothetical protein L3Q82_007115 [Scortum barcoo]